MVAEILAGVWAFMVAHPFITAAIVAALAFDFVNGFHDSANAIATVVATKVLTPLQAVLMAGFFNFVGPFLFSLAVATTIGKGIVDAKAIGEAAIPSMIMAALLGAIVWDLITWYVGLPTSSSHALVGGLVGAALAAAGPAGAILPTWTEVLDSGYWVLVGLAAGAAAGVVALGVSRVRLPRFLFPALAGAGFLAMGAVYLRGEHFPGLSKDALEWTLLGLTTAFLGALGGAVLWVVTQRPMAPRLILFWIGMGAPVALVVATLVGTLKLGGVTKTLVFMIVSPVLGFLSGFLLATIVSWWGQRRDPGIVSVASKRAQLFSSGFYALTHGTNDAQKTMGVIAVLLIAAGLFTTDTFTVPTWVVVSSALAMGLGTLFGGWRIVQTMAARITHLRPAQGFAAETGGGVVLVAMANAGIPVSTTHAISSSIMGVGATRRMSAVRWGVGRRIVGAWILTIPASAIVAFLSYFAVSPSALAWYAGRGVEVAVAICVLLLAVAALWWRRRGRATAEMPTSAKA